MRINRMVQFLIGATLGAGIANAGAAQKSGVSALRPEEATTRTPARSQSVDTLPDPAAVRQWASLTAHILEAFQRDRRSPIANIEGDFSSLEIRIRLVSSREDAWVERKFTTAELMGIDAKAVAKTLYDEAKRRA